MLGKSVYKVPDGKLLKISLKFKGEKIISVKITGDFFLYPEEGIEAIEKSLSGKKLDRKLIAGEVSRAVQKNSIELFGISAEGIAEGVLLAGGAAK